jgi:hypothetical protein
MSKTAAATLENNESSMIRPVTLPDAEGVCRTEHHPDPAHNGEAAWQEFTTGAPKMLGKVFKEFNSSATKDKAFIKEHFATRGYEARSPQLRKYAEAGEIPSNASLSERTRGLLPR